MTDRITNIQAELTCTTACTADIHCDDGNPCTDDVCDLATEFCMPPVNNTDACDDGASCTTGDVCSAGVCTGTSTCTGGFSCDVGADACVSGPVFEEFTEAQADGNNTSLTINTPAGTVEDDLLIAAVTLDGERLNLAPPGGEGWTQVDLGLGGGAGNVTFGVWWKLAGASESPSHTWTWSGNEEAYGYIMRFTGHDLVAPIDTSAVGTGNDASPAAPAITANTAGSLILRIGGFDDDDITTGDAGMAGTTTITMNKSSSGAGSASSGATWETRGVSPSVPAANFTLTASEEWRTVTLAIVGVACGDGVTEGAEQCDDGNTDPGDCCSPSCQYESAATVCRAAAGACDAADFCDGAGACTADGKLTSECRASTQACDVAEVCDGVGNDCPADAWEPDITECRASAGLCDVAEYSCSLSGGACPADGFAPTTTECRGAAGVC
ncbi:MAG: hypothetical protein ACYSUR_18115, partial [Planctomycetota bacterium]